MISCSIKMTLHNSKLIPAEFNIELIRWLVGLQEFAFLFETDPK